MDMMKDLEKTEINESELEQVTGGGLFDRGRRGASVSNLLFRDKEEDEAEVVLLPAPPATGVSSKQTKKAVEEQKQAMKEEAFNPYKEAKKSGKSVQEVIAQHEKEEAKRAAKEARKNKDEDDEYEWIDANTYRVARKRTVAEGGSSYITGRKAIAEAKAAEEVARKAEKAAQKRNVKKGKGKKK